MKKTLQTILNKDIKDKYKDLELQEFLGENLAYVLEKNNIESISEKEQEELIYNLRSFINYQEATDEDIENFFNALAKIIK